MLENVKPLDSGPLEVVPGKPEIKFELQGREASAEPLPIPTKEELTVALNAIGADMRNLILTAKRMKKEQGLEPHLDSTRSLAVAQQYLQTGFMWMRRAINPTKEF